MRPLVPLRTWPDRLRALGVFGGVEVMPEAMHLLAAWPWPGNVRELDNELRRAVLMRRDPARVGPEDLAPEIRAGATASLQRSGTLDLRSIELPEGGVDLAVLEKTLIEKALERTGGNQTKAAALLGITRQTLIYRMEKHRIKQGGPPTDSHPADRS